MDVLVSVNNPDAPKYLLADTAKNCSEGLDQHGVTCASLVHTPQKPDACTPNQGN